jgi:hypothetical protein
MCVFAEESRRLDRLSYHRQQYVSVDMCVCVCGGGVVGWWVGGWVDGVGCGGWGWGWWVSVVGGENVRVGQAGASRGRAPTPTRCAHPRLLALPVLLQASGPSHPPPSSPVLCRLLVREKAAKAAGGPSPPSAHGRTPPRVWETDGTPSLDLGVSPAQMHGSQQLRLEAAKEELDAFLRALDEVTAALEVGPPCATLCTASARQLPFLLALFVRRALHVARAPCCESMCVCVLYVWTCLPTPPFLFVFCRVWVLIWWAGWGCCGVGGGVCAWAQQAKAVLAGKEEALSQAKAKVWRRGVGCACGVASPRPCVTCQAHRQGSPN